MSNWTAKQIEMARKHHVIPKTFEVISARTKKVYDVSIYPIIACSPRNINNKGCWHFENKTKPDMKNGKPFTRINYCSHIKAALLKTDYRGYRRIIEMDEKRQKKEESDKL